MYGENTWQKYPVNNVGYCPRFTQKDDVSLFVIEVADVCWAKTDNSKKKENKNVYFSYRLC